MALNVGIVGARGIGGNHAQSHMDDDLSNLVAICDLHKDRADELAGKHGVKSYTTLHEMMANEDLDIVDVCTGGNENGSWHFEPVMEALEAGKHVLCEKPISNDIFEGRQMVAKAAEEDLYLGVNLNHYFTKPADTAMAYMQDDKIGEIGYCVHRMGFAGGEAAYKKSDAPRSKDFPYFHVKAFLHHPFSIMRYFCGNVTHVQAFMDRPGFRKHAGELMVSVNSIHLKFESGATGYMLSQRGDYTFGLGGWWSVEVGGSKGTFCIENCVEKVTYWPSPDPNDASQPENLILGQSPPPIVTESGVTDFGTTFPNRIHAYLEDVTNGVPKEKLRASGRDALAALEYTFAAIESYEEGGVLVRPEQLPTLKGDPLAQ
jgi:predicted dehydrogenase